MQSALQAWLYWCVQVNLYCVQCIVKQRLAIMLWQRTRRKTYHRRVRVEVFWLHCRNQLLAGDYC